MNINLKKEQSKNDLKSQVEKLKKDNTVLQSVIHELVMNPESEKAKGIMNRVKQFEAAKNK